VTTDTRPTGGAWSGWLIFAGAMLAAVGFVNAIQGLAALFKDEVYLVTDSGLLVTTDWTAWGWTLLIWGIVLVLAGFGLFAGKGWARWFAIVVVAINMIAQFAWFPAYPLWSLVAISLSVVVLYALTVRWDEATTLD
jgi:hypothetical protein